jgi:hypothetical protein
MRKYLKIYRIFGMIVEINNVLRFSKIVYPCITIFQNRALILFKKHDFGKSWYISLTQWLKITNTKRK